jgi:hypothetical protein
MTAFSHWMSMAGVSGNENRNASVTPSFRQPLGDAVQEASDGSIYSPRKRRQKLGWSDNGHLRFVLRRPNHPCQFEIETQKKVAGIVFRTPEVERIKQLISVDFGFTLIGASNALELDKAVGYVLRKITNRAIGGQHASALCTGRSVPN